MVTWTYDVPIIGARLGFSFLFESLGWLVMYPSLSLGRPCPTGAVEDVRGRIRLQCAGCRSLARSRNGRGRIVFPIVDSYDGESTASPGPRMVFEHERGRDRWVYCPGSPAILSTFWSVADLLSKWVRR
ncbi:hypothetical protein EDB83DRAFT_162401 [Lactarius deliciosus]|nr:hypothetical protein EDB83DRAFT_162401 [Lactarius deliciosus]